MAYAAHARHMHGVRITHAWYVHGVCTAHMHGVRMAHAWRVWTAPVLEAGEASVRLEARLEHLDRVDAAAAERAAREAREQPLGAAGRSVGRGEPRSGGGGVHLLDDSVEQPYPHGVEGDLARDAEREAALQAAHALGAEVLPHTVEPAPVHPRLSSEASLVVELQPHLRELEWMGEAHGDAARERWHAHLLQQAPLRSCFRHSTAPPAARPPLLVAAYPTRVRVAKSRGGGGKRRRRSGKSSARGIFPAATKMIGRLL